jgi:DNA polymerase III subunit beta
VLYSVSTVSTKPELGSVLFEAGEDGLVFAATDAFRLAEKKIKIRNTDAGMSCRVLIPYKNVIDLIRVFEGADADVLVVVGEHQMAVDGNDLYFTTRLVDAVFPDYPKLFPKESKSEVTVLRHDLIQAMKTAQIFSDKVSQVVVSVLREQERFEISSKNTDLGDQSELVDAVIEGEDITLSLNWRHILDCLNNISTDSVNMRFHGLGKPIVMRGVGDPSFAYLAMPLNVT